MKVIIGVLFLFILGCSSKPKKHDPVVQEEKEIPKAVVADDGPILKLGKKTQVSAVTEIKISNYERYATKTHTYLHFELGQGLPEPAHFSIPSTTSHYKIVITNGVQGDVYIRLVGINLKDDFEMNVASQYGSYKVLVTGAKKAKRGLKDKFYKVLGKETSYDSFGIFVQRRFGEATRRRMFSSRSELKDIMDMYSGATSIREALQNDRQLRASGKPELNIKKLEGVPLRQHPWKEMTEELNGETIIEALASYVPSDMAYLHFHDLRSFVKVVKEMDKLHPLFQATESRVGSREFADFYEKQLVLERSGVAELLGHHAVKDVALVVGDSFVREGTDVAMIFRVKNKTLLESALNKFEMSARSEHARMNQYLIKIEDVDVRRIYTDDLSVNQFRASYGEVLVIANSLETIRELVATFKKKRPAISDEGDFKYMRTKYPFNVEKEDGFVFLSDAFIAKVTSPQTRIASARRFAFEADLLSVNYGVILYADLEGVLPKDLSALVKSNILSDTDLLHSDGERIKYDPKRGAYSKYGSARMMIPLKEMKVKLVSKEEAKAYERFKQSYQLYWKNFMDPIAIRILQHEGEKGLQAEIRILPIIDSSDYNSLFELVGHERAPKFERLNDGAEWTFAVGENASLRKQADISAKRMGDFSLSWLGKWGQIGAADNSVFWDLALSITNIPTIEIKTGKENSSRNSTSGAYGFILRSYQRLPVHLAFEISNGVAFAAVLAKIKTMADEVAPGMVVWGPSGEVYKEHKIIKVTGKESDEFQITLYYAIVDGVFVISPRLDYLRLQIDKFMTDPTYTTAQSTMSLSLRKEGWMTKAAEIGLQASTELSTSHIDAMRLIERLSFASDYEKFSLNHLGIRPMSPFDGKITYENGVATHEHLGPLYENSKIQMYESSVNRIIDQSASIDASIAFDGEKNHRSLLIKLDWKKR